MSQVNVTISRRGVSGRSDVAIEPALLTVKGGGYLFSDPACSFSEDVLWRLPEFAGPSDTTGYLAVDRITKEVVLFVDEVFRVHTDRAVIWSDTPYDFLAEVFRYSRKTALDTLSTVDVRVFNLQSVSQ